MSIPKVGTITVSNLAGAHVFTQNPGELIVTNQAGQTVAAYHGSIPGQGTAIPAGSGWDLSNVDYLFEARLNGQASIIIACDSAEITTGLLTWDFPTASLTYVNGAEKFIPGSGFAIPEGTGWERGVNDLWLPADLRDQGGDLVVLNPHDQWIGIISWNSFLYYWWGTKGLLTGAFDYQISQDDDLAPGAQPNQIRIVRGGATQCNLEWQNNMLAVV